MHVQRICLVGIFVAFFVFSTAEASGISKDSASYQNYIRGLLLDEIGEYEQAKQAYQKAINYDSDSWDLHYRLGLDYVKLENFQQAEREFKHVLRLRPYNEKVRYLLALVYSQNKKEKEAICEYSILLNKPLLELEESDIRFSLAQLYLKKKYFDKAEIEYKTILEKDPNDSYAHFYLGYIYSETSKINDAINAFQKAIEINPNNSLALNSLGYLYAERSENLDEAIVLVRRALEFEPSNGAYLDTLGWIYFKKGELDNALRYLENASVLFKDAEIFEHLGDVHLKKGMKEKAREYWQKALKLQPERNKVKEKIKELNRYK